MTDRDSHVSDLRWDRLLAGELPLAQRDRAQTHAATCAACAARFRELAAGRNAFSLHPLPAFLATPARRARWRWAAPLAAAAAAAAVVLVMRHEPRTATERRKGSEVTLLLAAGTSGVLAPLAARDAIHPGEHLQAGYTSTRDGFGAVLSLDGVGAANVYVPSRANRMVALPAGVERSYPESTLLDEVVGSERVVVMWCDSAYPVKPWLDQLRDAHHVTPPVGCVVREIDLDKRAGP